MLGAMERCILMSAILASFIAWKANGFLFTPKFQLFLHQMRESGHNQDFVIAWDYSHLNNINPGFSYATNQYGEFGAIK